MDLNATGTTEYYEEVVDPAKTEPVQKKRGKPTRARTAPLIVRFNERIDIEPIKISCRCWRCRAGGVSVSEMGQMDRILARHLLRLSEEDREAWLREWEVNPNHGPKSRRKIETWMAIENGSNAPHPFYRAKVSYE